MKEKIKDYVINTFIIIGLIFIACLIIAPNVTMRVLVEARIIKGTHNTLNGTSMTPNYQNGEVVYMIPIVRPSELIRNTIVVVGAHENHSVLVMKRVIGLPGETVVYDSDRYYINGVELVPDSYDVLRPTGSTEYVKYTLGVDEYFIAGDNYAGSLDSRDYGPVPFKAIQSFLNN